MHACACGQAHTVFCHIPFALSAAVTFPMAESTQCIIPSKVPGIQQSWQPNGCWQSYTVKMLQFNCATSNIRRTAQWPLNRSRFRKEFIWHFVWCVCFLPSIVPVTLFRQYSEMTHLPRDGDEIVVQYMNSGVDTSCSLMILVARAL